MRSIVRMLFLLLLLACGLPSTAHCQLDRGGITGRIFDPSGAVVPGAQVIFTNLNTAVRNEAASNEAGFYNAPNLPAGSYKITFSKKGFKTTEQREIAIAVGQTVQLDVALETGQIEETVVVNEQASPLQVNNPVVATIIRGDEINDLPLSFSEGRQIERFAYALTPVVEGDSWTSHIAGTPAFTKEVLIDGLSATSQIQGNVMESSPPMDSIQEFSVQTAGMPAEYGHTGSGVFNFALKAGTNSFNGSAFYYARNEALNANTWMNNWQQGQHPGDDQYKRSRDRQALGGIGAGGPVVLPGLYDGRNRTFFFGAFEHYSRQSLQLGAMNRTVPLPDFLEGDFSRLLTTAKIADDALDRPVYAGQIFDPRSLRQVEGVWVSDPFDGNVISGERLSAVSRRVIDIFKSSYQPMIPGVLTNNSAGPASVDPWFHQTQLMLKGDHAFSSTAKLSGSLIWTQRPRILADEGGVWDPQAEGDSGGPFARARNQKVTSRAIRLSGHWSPRPNFIHTISFVYNRYRNPSLSAQADGEWNRQLGLQDSTGSGLFPEISFGPSVNGNGTTTIGYGNSEYLVANNNILSSTADWSRGRHTVRFGGEFWAQQLNSHAGADVLSFRFSPMQTGIPGQPWSNQVGFGFASFFLGEAEGGSKNVPFDLYGRRKYVALFVQDNYRINNSITLNFGLRWEQSRPLHEKYGRWASFNPDLVNTNYNTRGALEFLAGSNGTFEKQTDWKEFGPHAGIAYRLGEKFALRAGYSLDYIPLGMNYWGGVPYAFAPGYRGTNNRANSSDIPSFNWDDGYPDNFQPPTRDPNALVYGMVSVDQRSLFAGYTHLFNVSLQYEAAKDMVLEVAFIGNEGRRLHNGALNRNQPSRADYENPAANPYDWIWDEASAAAAGVAYPYYGFSNYAGVALQPFPQVASDTGGPLYFVGTPKGTSGYRSLQASLTKKTSADLGLQISYTLSRAVGNSETGFDETWDPYGGIQDIYNVDESGGTVLSFDRRHIVKGFVSYQLPFGRGRRFLSSVHSAWNSILGGWKVTGIFTYSSGMPLAVYPNVWYPGWEGAVYADFNPAIDLSRQFNGAGFNPGDSSAAGNLYFNPAAFSDPQNHKLGNGKRLYTELRGFGYAGEDLGLMKHFRFRERYSAQLRAELLNVFNRHYFADPNTSMGDASTFGHVTSTTGNPRTIQVGLRLSW